MEGIWCQLAFGPYGEECRSPGSRGGREGQKGSTQSEMGRGLGWGEEAGEETARLGRGSRDNGPRWT